MGKFNNILWEALSTQNQRSRLIINNNTMDDLLICSNHSSKTGQIPLNFTGSFLALDLQKYNKVFWLTHNNNNIMADFLFYIHRDLGKYMFVLDIQKTQKKHMRQHILNCFTIECFDPNWYKKKIYAKWNFPIDKIYFLFFNRFLNFYCKKGWLLFSYVPQVSATRPYQDPLVQYHYHFSKTTSINILRPPC